MFYLPFNSPPRAKYKFCGGFGIMAFNGYYWGDGSASSLEIFGESNTNKLSRNDSKRIISRIKAAIKEKDEINQWNAKTEEES